MRNSKTSNRVIYFSHDTYYNIIIVPVATLLNKCNGKITALKFKNTNILKTIGAKNF